MDHKWSPRHIFHPLDGVRLVGGCDSYPHCQRKKTKNIICLVDLMLIKTYYPNIGARMSIDVCVLGLDGLLNIFSIFIYVLTDRANVVCQF